MLPNVQFLFPIFVRLSAFSLLCFSPLLTEPINLPFPILTIHKRDNFANDKFPDRSSNIRTAHQILAVKFFLRKFPKLHDFTLGIIL